VPPGLRGTAYADLDDVDRATWNAVVDAGGAPFFYRHEFLRALQAHPLYETRDARHVLIRDDTAAVVAVLPLYLVATASPLTTADDPGAAGGPCWVTHLPHWYDSRLPSTVALDEVVAGLGALLADLGVPSVTLQNVGSRPLLEALTGAGHRPEARDTRYTMDLKDHASYEEWLQARGRSTRRNLRRAVKRAQAAGWDHSVSVGAPDPARVVDLCRLSTAKHGNDEWLPRERTINFIRALPQDSVVLHQWANRRGVVAGAVGFVDRGCYHSWSGGVDPALLTETEVDANALLYVSELMFSYRHGLTYIEGGRRSGELKTRLGMSPTVLHTVRVGAR
jgi:predicted N-acyltransferase